MGCEEQEPSSLTFRSPYNLPYTLLGYPARELWGYTQNMYRAFWDPVKARIGLPCILLKLADLIRFSKPCKVAVMNMPWCCFVACDIRASG